MKTVGKKDVYSSQSAEFIQQGEKGKWLKLISDTFILKMEQDAQGYALRHLNGKDMVLIDTVGEGAQKAIKLLVEEGYTIKGIILTHKAVVDSAYAPLETISEDAGGAPVFSHPMNVHDIAFKVKDISFKNNVFDHFSLTIIDFPSNSGEASVIHSEINEGMLFVGNTAVGAAYDSNEKGFRRPKIGGENKNFSLAESWSNFTPEFNYIFPYKGKPGFNLWEEQTDIILKLSNGRNPDSVNPNL